MPAPRRDAPRTMWLAVVCGALSGFLFLVACLFCVQDLDRVLSPPLGFPFIEVARSTLGLDPAAALVALFVVNGLGQGAGILTSASRLTWSFARDGGLPFAAYFAHVDARWRVPARALWLQAGLVSLVGLLYLFANAVLQAVLSVSTIALTVSYAVPVAVVAVVGRDRIPPRPFDLGRLGPPVNAVSLLYCAVTTIVFFFPAHPDPRPGDMNYAIAVFGVMFVVALGFWLVQGRRTYLQTAGEVLYADDSEAADGPARAAAHRGPGARGSPDGAKVDKTPAGD